METSGEPAILTGLHKASGSDLDPSRGIRTMKLVSPICDICAPEQWVAAHNWWKDCPHSPYTHFEAREEVEVVYETLPSGERAVVSRESTTIERPWPNLRQLPATTRHGGKSDQSGAMARSKFNQFGWIPPEDIRCEAFPHGIAAMCQFRDCFSQDLKHYTSGWFCQEDEAVICYEDDHYVKAEINNGTLRQEQFADSRSRLRAMS